jgi:hypothetical protein
MIQARGSSFQFGLLINTGRKKTSSFELREQLLLLLPKPDQESILISSNPFASTKP